MISYVTSLLKGINIASLNCDRSAKGKDASMIICIDGILDESIIEKIEQSEDVYFVTYVEKLEH